MALSESEKERNSLMLILMFLFILASAVAGVKDLEGLNVLFFMMGLGCAVLIGISGGK